MTKKQKLDRQLLHEVNAQRRLAFIQLEICDAFDAISDKFKMTNEEWRYILGERLVKLIGCPNSLSAHTVKHT